jgi:hypothetical protein
MTTPEETARGIVDNIPYAHPEIIDEDALVAMIAEAIRSKPIMNAYSMLELIIDMTPHGAQRRALEQVLADITVLEDVARMARLLALGTIDPQKYVTDLRWAEDIIKLTEV